MAMVPVKVQCKGINKSGLQCYNMITRGTHCKLHSDQDLTAPPVLRCGGETIDGKRCSNLVHGQSFDQPNLCFVHKRAQRRRPAQLKYITCFGKEADGQRCKTSVSWKPPYAVFCTKHQNQATTFGAPITNLPTELDRMIVANLAPIDRVSFALANSSCAAVVRAWGQTTHQRRMLRAHDLTYISSLTDEIAGPFYPPMILYTLDNPDNLTLVQLLHAAGPNFHLPLLIAYYMSGIHRVACKGVEFKVMSNTQIPFTNGNDVEDWVNYFPVTRLTNLRRRLANAIERYPHLFPGSVSDCIFCGRFGPHHHESPTWMCDECEHLEILVPWCEKCSGPLPILALARSIGEFYKTHKERFG